MRRGTKSLLFGAHQVVLHPLFVACAWWQLYGFPCDPRLWVAFVVHDWGYWGKARMEDADGQTHPEHGACIMRWFFGPRWSDFTRFHSRAYARMHGQPVSPLCAADKLVTALMPGWLYVSLATLSGEIQEYMALPESRAAGLRGEHNGTRAGWFAWLHHQLRQAARTNARPHQYESTAEVAH